eukprot:12072125-Alexandrium_andersonii.AAC.1
MQYRYLPKLLAARLPKAPEGARSFPKLLVRHRSCTTQSWTSIAGHLGPSRGVVPPLHPRGQGRLPRL